MSNRQDRKAAQIYVDRFGHKHTDAIIWAWSERMREIMQIRKIEK